MYELGNFSRLGERDGPEPVLDAFGKKLCSRELKRISKGAELALCLGLTLNAGHGLDYKNVLPIAHIKGMNELNIGFSIVSQAVFDGLGNAVKKMKQLLADSV